MTVLPKGVSPPRLLLVARMRASVCAVRVPTWDWPSEESQVWAERSSAGSCALGPWGSTELPGGAQGTVVMLSLLRTCGSLAWGSLHSPRGPWQDAGAVMCFPEGTLLAPPHPPPRPPPFPFSPSPRPTHPSPFPTPLPCGHELTSTYRRPVAGVQGRQPQHRVRWRAGGQVRTATLVDTCAQGWGQVFRNVRSPEDAKEGRQA